MFLVNTNHFRWAWATGISVLAVLSVHADNHQPVVDSLVMNPSVVDRDYQETELRFYASPSQNASFLTEMEGGNLSYLECSGQLRRGKLVDYYQSDRSRIFDVQTGSYYRFSDRLMLAGSLENEENSYKESTDANGVSQIVYYGSNRVGKKVWKGASVSYTLLSGSTLRKRADWMAGMEAGYEARLLTASPYPFYRKQDIRTVHGTAFFTRNWLGRKQGYSLSVEAGYAAGWGHRNQDGTYASVSEHQKAPVSLEHYLNQEYDYRVSRQVKSGVSGGYERALSSRLSLYAKAEVTYLVALNTRLKGESQTVCGLSAGVKF